MKLKVAKLTKEDKTKFGYYNPTIFADGEETIEDIWNSNILNDIDNSMIETIIIFNEDCSTIEEAEKIAADYKKYILKELKQK